MNLTPLQIIGIVLVINGALIGSAAQLTDLFGPLTAKYIISIASLGNSIFGGIVTMISGQGSQLKNVAGIVGDDGKPAVRINVNANAGPALASAAINPALANVGASTPEAQAILTETAKGA